MSDDESNRSEQEHVAPAKLAPAKKSSSKAPESADLDDTAKELLELNRQERDKMEEEIEELRKRSEKRKKQREIEEKRLAAERVAEDERRKAAEETKKRQKSEDEERKQKERAIKMAEFEKWKTPQKRNFIITRKEAGEEGEEEESPEDEKEDKSHKTKEQLEAEKRAILKQRVKPMDIDGLDAAKLAEKAKEFHSWLTRLEGERYDLEKRYKSQQAALMDLAERARQVNKVGKGGLKRVGGAEDEVDKIQARFAGAPAKVEMFSKYERQKDKRSYEERFNIFTGPQFVSPPERIKPNKIIHWDGEGMPVYGEGAVAAGAE